MMRYAIKLYSGGKVLDDDKSLTCDKSDVSNGLGCVVRDYLKNAPYPGAIDAVVTSDESPMVYMVLQKNNDLDVYLHMSQLTEGEVQELSDEEEPAR